MKGYLFLIISIIVEVVATTMLKVSDGFSILLPSIIVIAGYGLSFFLLSLSLQTIPLSSAYAIWSGAGTALTALIGILIWNETLSILKLSGIAMIIGGIVMLNTAQKRETAAKASSS